MPFITVPYPPKYPLTESEKAWLEARKYLCYSCAEVGHPEDVWCKGGFSDWKITKCRAHSPLRWVHNTEAGLLDCAMFEARVGKLILEGLVCVACPNWLAFSKCPATQYDRPGYLECQLKRARILVEETMD